MRRAMLLPFLLCCAPTSVDHKAQVAARISYDLGVESFNHGDTRGALQELLKAVKKNPNLAEAHHALGLVFHTLQRHEDALTHYKRAIALKPAFSVAHNNLGTLLLDLGRYDEAIESFDRALSDILYATPSMAEGNLGWAYYKKGEVKTGEKHLRNAVAMNPKFCRGYEWLARIGLDKDDAALTLWAGKRFARYCAEDDAVAHNVSPDYLRQMQYYLGMGYLKKGEHQRAREVFDACALDDEEAPFGQKCHQSLNTLN